MGLDLSEAERVGYVDYDKKVYRTWVPFSSGMVGFGGYEPDDHMLPLYQELTDALDLGFVRFLDFQRLEEQNIQIQEANRLSPTSSPACPTICGPP